jgi:serine protease
MKTTPPALTPPPRPRPRGLRLNQFVAAATVAGVAASALGLATQLRPVQAATALSGGTTLLVKLAEASGDAAAQQAAMHRMLADTGLPLRVDRPLGSGWWRLQATAGTAKPAAWLARLRADRRVAHAMNDVREQRAAVPNDPLFRAANAADSQWWLDDQSDTSNAGAANFTKAWDTTQGSASPIIAVLDSGITSHADLNAHILGGYNFVSRPEYANNGGVGRSATADDPGDALSQAEFNANPALWDGCVVNPTSSWHGTLIAGQLGALTNNGGGVAGINWNARILPVRVSGKCGASVADMVDGMRWAAGLNVAGAPVNSHPAKILVIGFASVKPLSCNVADPDPDVAAAARLYADAIAELRNLGQPPGQLRRCLRRDGRQPPGLQGHLRQLRAGGATGRTGR